ncbi:prepilin peptidase [Glycomyces sp. NPDC046736]|uniref:prepilin peptidase n=1 Tax=Glycomyces sp. NPDC046736 TaxID=3155615 RepID=UPI0033E3C8A2
MITLNLPLSLHDVSRILFGSFAIAIVMWKIAEMLEPANADFAPKGGRGGRRALAGVSVASAVSAIVMAQLVSARPGSSVFVLFAAIAPGLAWIDLRSMFLPFPILTIMALAALVTFSVDALWSGSASHLVRAVSSGLIVVVVGWAWWKGASDQIGLGDVALLGVVGLYLGWWSVPVLWTGLVLACLLWWTTIAMVRLGRSSTGPYLPLGPALLGGCWWATALAATGGL